MPHLDVMSETKGGARTREGVGWAEQPGPQGGPDHWPRLAGAPPVPTGAPW